jgi:hypothetical protein
VLGETMASLATSSKVAFASGLAMWSCQLVAVDRLTGTL